MTLGRPVTFSGNYNGHDDEALVDAATAQSWWASDRYPDKMPVALHYIPQAE